MRAREIMWISILSFFIGALLLAYYQRMIIFTYSPNKKTKLEIKQVTSSTKKKVMLHYWHHDAWHHEETDLIWSDDHAANIRYLINNLLSLMLEEEALPKKVTVETVMLLPTGQEAFISFDRHPFSKDSSTFEKWMIIESMLKTIHAAEIPTQSIRFCVHHKPLYDYHLDFTNGWLKRGSIS